MTIIYYMKHQIVADNLVALLTFSMKKISPLQSLIAFADFESSKTSSLSEPLGQ